MGSDRLIMKKHKILIICLIFLFLWTVSVRADDKWWDLNSTYKQTITNIPTEYPTPILIRINPVLCTFSDCRDFEIEDNLPFKLFDLDKDGIPEYAFFIANLNADNLNKSSRIEYSSLPPRIKYENQTLINTWEICYQKYNSTICQWDDNKDSDINYSVGIFPADIKDRFDLYTVAKFNSSPAVEYFCPLVLDLDTWPQNTIFLLDKEIRNNTEIGLYPAISNIENREIYNGASILDLNQKDNKEWIVTANHEIYTGALILTGSNESIIITKPSVGLFNPSPDYFFKTEIIPNGHIRALACTTNHTGEILPSKGPNAYFVFGKPDTEKLFRMSVSLSNIPDPIVHPPESIKTKFFEGSVWPLGKPTFPEIVPKIELKSNENFFRNITFTWMKQEGEASITIQSVDGTLIFEQPILLNSSSWKYPFDTYEAFVYYNPLVIANGNSSLSFDFGVPYQGAAAFTDGKISLSINRNDDSRNKYFLYLIFCGLIFLFSNWHIKNLNKYSFQPKKLLEKLGLIVSPLFGYFFFISDIQYSIGTIPYVVMVSWLVICFYLRWKKLNQVS